MKIAQVAPFFYPVEGGVERHVLNISRELVRRGHEVQVLTSNALYGKRRVQSQNDIVDNIRVRRSRVLLTIGSFAKFWPGVLLELQKGEFDIVHTHVYRHPHSDLALLSSKLKKRKCVLTTHSPFHPYKVRAWSLRTLARLYDKVNGKVLARRFDAVIAVSSSEVPNILDLGVGEDRVHVIPNGVERENFESCNPKDFLDKFSLDNDFVLYLGKLHETKGCSFLINSFRRVVDSVPDALLVITGSGTEEYEMGLRKLVKNLQLQDNVVFTGFVSKEMKMKAYSACRFLVLPSIYEPFGIVLLEAMAHGKPVVSTNAGGPTDIIRDGYNGLLVQYGNESDLANKMMRLIRNDYLTGTMGKKARKEAEKYAWPKITDTILTVYDSVLGSAKLG